MTLTSGETITNCAVLQQNKENTVLLLDYGTLTLPRASVKGIAEDGPQGSPKEEPPIPKKSAEGRRLPSWGPTLLALSGKDWAKNIAQIPATVIDVGVLRSVPYMSFRFGTSGELNIYGDPDDPAAVEIGLYGPDKDSVAAKRKCLEFMSSVLVSKADAGIVKALNLTEDNVSRSGLTAEVTPADAPDAYGGWWVSIYFLERLDLARAGKEELEGISVRRETTDVPSEPGAEPPAKPAPTAEPANPVPPRRTELRLAELTRWSKKDMERARPPTKDEDQANKGRVYVRGYYRKDGTYVKGHSRRR